MAAVVRPVRCIDCAHLRESWEWGDGESGEYGCACTDDALKDVTRREHCDMFEDRWEPSGGGEEVGGYVLTEHQYGWIGGN